MTISPRDIYFLNAKVQTAAGGSIKTVGSKEITICVKGQHCKWRFMVGNVKLNLLGCDFLKEHSYGYNFNTEVLYTTDYSFGNQPKGAILMNWEYLKQQLSYKPDISNRMHKLLMKYAPIINEPVFYHRSIHTKILEITLTDPRPV